jgi:hypothetical protein
MKSRPRIASSAFFTAPIPGVASSAVSSAPPKRPLCRIAMPTAAMATTAPSYGMERERRRAKRPRAYCDNWLLSVISARSEQSMFPVLSFEAWAVLRDLLGDSRACVRKFPFCRSRLTVRLHSTTYCSGTTVAFHFSMSTTFAVTAATSCPGCGRRVEPAPDSTWIIAWYLCPRCGHEWSARIRDGRPDSLAGGDVFGRLQRHYERP